MLYKSFGLKKNMKMKNVRSLDGFSRLNVWCFSFDNIIFCCLVGWRTKVAELF